MRLAAAPLARADLRHGANGAADRRVPAEPGKPHHLRRARLGRSTSCRCCCPRISRSIAFQRARRVPVCGHPAGQAAAVDDLPGQGRQGSVPVMVRGKLGREGELRELPLPRSNVAVCGRPGSAARRPGRAGGPGVRRGRRRPENCEPVLLGRLYAWLNPAQQRSATAWPALRPRRLRRHAAADAAQGRRGLRHDHQRPRDRSRDRGDDPAGLHASALRACARLSFLLPGGDGRQPDQRAHAAAEDGRAARQRAGRVRCACGSSCKTK